MNGAHNMCFKIILSKALQDATCSKFQVREANVKRRRWRSHTFSTIIASISTAQNTSKTSEMPTTITFGCIWSYSVMFRLPLASIVSQAFYPNQITICNFGEFVQFPMFMHTRIVNGFLSDSMFIDCIDASLSDE